MSIDYESYLVQLSNADRDRSGLSDDHKSIVERLLDRLESHERSERALLDDYRQAAETSADRGIRFLMGLVLEDEERHHRLMSAMAKDVRASVLWQANEPPLPGVSPNAEDKAALKAQTVRFLEIEEESADQLKELQNEVKRIHSGLLQVIVEGMEADTHKHIGILKYIRSELESR